MSLSCTTAEPLPDAYAKVANISVERAINDACKEWMDYEGDRLVAYIQRKYPQPVASKPVAKRKKAA
ncbi:MAG: hypothetical protein RB191_16450 [Terriglobia bacterium]|nr:hypothetical protein [Terriglobia bacterium]